MYRERCRFPVLERDIDGCLSSWWKDRADRKRYRNSFIRKAKVNFTRFSTQEFSITPTELTSKYNQIPLEELVKMLVALL